MKQPLYEQFGDPMEDAFWTQEGWVAAAAVRISTRIRSTKCQVRSTSRPVSHSTRISADSFVCGRQVCVAANPLLVEGHVKLCRICQVSALP